MPSNRDKVIIKVFQKNHVEGAEEVVFTLDDVRQAVQEVGYVDKNVPDIAHQYSAGRSSLPSEITQRNFWAILGRGKSSYAFVKLQRSPEVDLPADMSIIPIPDSTPEIVLQYAGSDEQALLAKLLYNRLVDCFLGLTCYHIQNHWRTQLKGRGQIEIDALYIGLDKRGRHYIIPIEAKGQNGRISRVQISNNIAFARGHYPKLYLRPLGAKQNKDGSIYLCEFKPGSDIDSITLEEIKRYRLVPKEDIDLDQIQGDQQ